MNATVHIASLLVHARAEAISQVERDLLAIDGAEIAHSDEQGRLIVTLETANEAEIVQALTDIQLLTGVVSASLVYHQTDGAPEAAPTSLQGDVK
ncbi:chaperone NapD [Roseibium aggregatum]|jgi:nitrate reductase NapD|uniref:chaperone NapD n=1 Tax=Roseibium aggregatum TaxID=187304 RepID=UPI003A976435